MLTKLEQYKNLINNTKLDFKIHPSTVNTWQIHEIFAGHLLLEFRYKCDGWHYKEEETNTNDLVFQGKYILIDDVFKECGESEDFNTDEIAELESMIFNKIHFS